MNEKSARVSASVGMTFNLGNYESLRVDCGIELPCKENEAQNKFKEAWEIVQKELEEQAKGIKKGGKEEK